LLTNTSLDARNYLELEQNLQAKETELATSEQILTDLKKQAESKEKDQAKALKVKENALTRLEQRIKVSKELIFNLRKEIRANQLYYQQELRKVKEDYQTKLQDQTKQLKEQITLLNSSGTDYQRELTARSKLIATLEEQAKEVQKELDFANSKIKQLNPLFSQVLAVIKKNVILRGKKDLKEAISLIQELMN
jgi:chromosome segregation ATPase